jgi:TolB-like protein
VGGDRAPSAGECDVPAQAATDPAPASARSVAVLPLVALTRGEDDDYFADGLTEELINALAALPDLLVTARTSSFHFKGRDVPVPEVARTLGVAHVVEGSVRRDGERLRITAQLIRGSDGFHVWSHSYDRDRADVFAVQLEIAQNVAEALDLVLDSTARARMADAGVRDVEAFIEFQKGRALYDAAHGVSRFDSMLVDANIHFERAIARAPNLWLAHLLHSDLHLHRLLNLVYGRRLSDPDAGNLALARQQVANDLAAASRHAPAPEQQAVADMHRILISDDWTGLAEAVGTVLGAGRCLPAFYLDRLIPFDRVGAVQRLAARNVSCDPLDRDSWYTYVESLRQSSPAKALEVADEAIRRLGGATLMSQKVWAQLAVKQFDAAENALRSPELSEAERINLVVALHAARGNAGAAREEAAALFGRYGSHDLFAVIFAAWVGDAASANAVATRIDERESGPFALLGVLLSCSCGAPFDLDATPSLKARLSEAGFAWPPATVFVWPLKGW